MRPIPTRAQALWRILRGAHTSARALAIADSRTFVRSMFLASAVRLGILERLRAPQSCVELATTTGTTRPDRLQAWLDVGVELHELRRDDAGRYSLRGRRARAIADKDPVLVPHYRSMLDYQAGPYDELETLLRADPDAEDGRDDLSRHAAVIAEVSLAAAPFVIPFLDEVVTTLHPCRALDVGCGTGVYTAALLAADPTLEVDGLDLAPDVVEQARAHLDAAGFTSRSHLEAADVRDWDPPSGRIYELITLLNDIYYFAEHQRSALYRRLGAHLAPDGELVIVTMTRHGSIASAHLHFMLAAQAGAASLPETEALDADLHRAGFTVLEHRALVPTEPFLAVRARLAGAAT
jgi:SAM-dependent methyltransferase